MRYYAAPMEGITGYVFRNAHHACFPGADAYYTPFLTPNQNHAFSSKELNDVLPAHNTGVPVIPQILTNNAADFLWAAGELAQMGYGEVNLNLGCPSPTVVTKGKGSGMLAEPDKLDRFLDEIYSHAPMKVSVKTRIGLSDESEFPALMEIFNRYPIAELIVHLRVQQDMYKNHPRMDAFRLAEENSKSMLAYNGDLNTAGECLSFEEAHPKVQALMLGRGLIVSPGIISQTKSGDSINKSVLKAFHDRIFEGYRETMPGDKPLIFKMREIWHYMIGCFEDTARIEKKLKKVGKAAEYAALIQELFDNCELRKEYV